MSIHEGVQGAKVQSWKQANPRHVLRKIVEENPGASQSMLYEELSRRVLADEDMIQTIIENWFTNNYRALMDERVARPPRGAAQRSAQIAQIGDEVRTKIKQHAAIMLMDMIMPNGRALRDCTGKECRLLSGKIGSWLKAVADRVKPSQKIGDHLDEAALQELYGRASP